MPKTLKDLTVDVRTLCDDSALPQATITGWLNEALADLAEVLRLETRTTAVLVAGQAEYALPADLSETRLLLLPGRTTPPALIPISDMESEGYKLWGGAVIFQPAPASAGTMELWYYRIPKALAKDEDVPEVPDQFQHVLTWYAAAVYHAEQKQISLEQALFWPTYQQGKAAILRHSQQRGRQQSSKQWRVER